MESYSMTNAIKHFNNSPLLTAPNPKKTLIIFNRIAAFLFQCTCTHYVASMW